MKHWETQIKDKAGELGFDLVGITTAEPIDPEDVEQLRRWLDEGLAGDLEYMHRNIEKRIDPGKLLPGAKSVICVGLNYKPPEDLSVKPNGKGPYGRVVNYSLYDDYHTFIKDRLFKLSSFIQESTVREEIHCKACVDSAPLAERALARRAGLGFIGKNHMLIHPQRGPQILLGELLTTLPLEPDEAICRDCGACRKCLDACPTGALQPDGRFDARRCISYLTGEFDGSVCSEVAARIGDRVYRCEECILACPYTANAPPMRNADFGFRGERKWLPLKEVVEWDQAAFESLFKGTVVEWTGLKRLRRAARICLENGAR
ncbi:MAG: tRNA epoxyqueuosine(34) reductase QueG [Sedimentisphaerales bacterium]|nr:tRNA epoxyqueuosine(34) reductase QueG [Sedimentisphaerales bacterium]